MSFKQIPTTQRRSRVVVVEDGAKPFDSLLASDEYDETVMVGQSSGEGLVELTSKVIQRIEALEHSARSVGSAVVLIAPRFDERTMTERRLLGRELLKHVRSSLDGLPAEMVWAFNGNAEVALSHGLMGLVEELLASSESTTVSIRVCFGDASQPSIPEAIWRASDEIVFADGALALKGA